MNRRRVIRLALGAMAGMGVAGKAFAMPAERSGNSATDVRRKALRDTMKLRAALDSRLTIEWFDGVVSGVVQGRVTPLFTVQAAAFARYAEAEDGSYRGRRVEVSAHGDLESGARLTGFRNPYNDQMMDVPLARTPVLPVAIGLDGLVLPPMLGPLRVEAQSDLVTVAQNNGRRWLRLDTRSSLYAPGAEQAPTHYSESLIYNGLVAELDDPAVLSAACQLDYHSVMSWRPWMKMDGIDGHTITVAAGEKVTSVEELPPVLQAFLNDAHPDLATDAGAAKLVAPDAAERPDAPGA